jgi:hypothetical protein
MEQKKLKTIKNENQDVKEIRNLIIITVIVVGIALLLYFLTDKVVEKKKDTTTTTTSAVKIDYDICTIGTMFNRPYTSYYVFLYDNTSEDASQYNTLLSNYKDKSDAIKIYYVDLSKKFNSGYVSDSSNKKPASASDVKIKGSALVLIKNGSVSKYYETTEEYEKVLN